MGDGEVTAALSAPAVGIAFGGEIGPRFGASPTAPEGWSSSA